MNTSRIVTRYIIGTSFFLSLFITQNVFASSESIKTMAGIMSHLNHYPNSAEKETLNKLLKETTTTDIEKTLATAIINLQHSATAADKKKLSKIINDNSASRSIRDLATIIHNLDHQPSPADIQKLKSMM
ncbi:MAG: hypothetical protein GXP08_06915 [Gammaproteobacteria bacterium]|nr:hypothetical protein [Gammaproteobacteria bacterium]